MNLHVEFDPQADAIYVAFRPLSRGDSAGTKQLDERRILDLDATGELIGIEFLRVSDGIDFEGVPHADEVRQTLAAFPAINAAA